MRIQNVQIRNFRTLGDVSIDFDSVTTFIGPNGSGKSTVLRALDWFFNGKPNDISEEDCSYGATEEDIEVQVTFTDLKPQDREELGKYAPDSAETFTAWKRRMPTGEEILSANAKGLPEFNEIKTSPSAKLKKDRYSELRDSRQDLDLPPANTGSAIDQAMTAWESEHTDQLVNVPEELQTNFFGFNSGGKMSGLFDFVLVTADLRASEESLDAKASIIGRILERSIDRSAADEEIAQIVKESRSKQQEVYSRTFSSELQEMTQQLNDVVATYSPGREINVSPAEVELKAPRTTFDVTVFDGDTSTAVERQGHGFQRTMLISALQVLAESGTASSQGVICLAIEEPELYQHPIQAQGFAKVLRALADDTDKNIQITYATHSPYFIEARHFDQIRRLTRSADDRPVVTIHSSSVSDVKNILAGTMKPEVIDRQIDSIVANQLSLALFSQRVLLVEGTTELAVFYGIGDRHAVGSLEAAGVSIVATGGKMNIPVSHSILTSLGIPTYSLFDGDGEFESRARAKGKSDSQIDKERRSHVSANETLLKYFELPVEDFPSAQVEDRVAVFDDHLESYMTSSWPEWSESCDAIQTNTGISLEKNQSAYRVATLDATGKVPYMLCNILERLKSI